LELEFVTSTLNWWRTESPNWMQLCITTFGVLDRNIFNSVAPENWDISVSRTVKFDVYGFGIMFWELVTEQRPFGGNGQFGSSLMYHSFLYKLGAAMTRWWNSVV